MLDFVCIGAQKCGTTWLYEHLRKHPEITFPAGKEVHFWDKKYAKGVGWYQSLFGGVGLDAKRCGEITPSYAILSPELIKECHKNFPDLKIIYLIRNPIERAWSSAKMALGRAEMRMEEASNQWFIDHFQSSGSVMRGDYAACLRNWCGVYSSKQLLVCLYDELQTDPEALLRKCFMHLDVDAAKFDWSTDLGDKIFASFEAPLSGHLRAELRRIYRPRIAELANVLGSDLSHWC